MVDILTHALIGGVLASPFFDSAPIPAACLVFGAVLPDLDAFSRLLGKRAFMHLHQTLSHGLPAIITVALVGSPILSLMGLEAAWAGPALAAGMLVHTLLDLTNTYGIALFAPLSRRRFSMEWIFFIDAFVIAASGLSLGLAYRAIQTRGHAPPSIAIGFCAFFLLYAGLKAWLRSRAAKLAPEGTLALMPSALVPWHFLGCARSSEDRIETFLVDLLRGELRDQEEQTIHDGDLAEALASVPEFAIMRSLSPAYHAVQVEDEEAGRRVLCRDLRTRNFKTRFGELELRLDAAGAVQETLFHV